MKIFIFHIFEHKRENIALWNKAEAQVVKDCGVKAWMAWQKRGGGVEEQYLSVTSKILQIN